MTTVATILKHKGYQVTTVDPTALVLQVAELLSERRIGAALVMDWQTRCWGLSVSGTSFAAWRRMALTRWK